MKDFRDLQVWSKAHELTLWIYGATKGFPRDELYGLTSQMRRCSASIGANIAEGCGRHGDGEFHRFLQMAMGSASELEYHLLLARDLHYMSAQDHKNGEAAVQEIKRMLASLITKVDKDRGRAAGAK
jgi:four helix bundle protein